MKTQAFPVRVIEFIETDPEFQFTDASGRSLRCVVITRDGDHFGFVSRFAAEHFMSRHSMVEAPASGFPLALEDNPPPEANP